MSGSGSKAPGRYGSALTRHLRGAGVAVVEVDRPDRKARRAKGKSDPLDAYAAARAALAGTASGCPKSRDGRVEAIRALRVARSSAVKARSQSSNQIKALLVTGPAELREQLRTLSTTGLITACTRLRPTTDPADPEQATKTARPRLPRLGRRHQHLTEEITEADSDLRALITAAAPQLLALPGVGTEVTGQLLTTAGDNPDRLCPEAAFAHLCGIAPIPASSRGIHRHRLNRGGDRAANNALYIVVLGRLRYDPRTRAHADRRKTEGLSKPEIIRSLKRYIAREMFRRPHQPHWRGSSTDGLDDVNGDVTR